MITLEQAIAGVQEVYSRGVQSKDSRLSDRMIYQALTIARATVIRQQSNSGQHINDYNYQYLPCVELQPSNYHECPCAPPSGCKILRTKHKVPSTINNLSGNLITFTSIEGNTSFDPTTFDTVRYAKGNKYTSTKPLVFPRNGYYFFSMPDTNLEVVAGRGLFNDPVAAYLFSSKCECEECECNDIMQMEFPIDENAAGGMFTIAKNELVLILKQIKEDRNNDASDDETVVGLIHQPKQQ
jgi:hypothetical protein